MAKQTLVQFIDDLDGSEAVGTVEFSLDGHTYEIDLSEANASNLRDALAEFVSAARRSGGSTRKPRGTASKPSTDAKAAREWLRANGFELSDRGRIPVEYMDIYAQRNVGAQVADEPLVDDEPDDQLGEEAGSSVEVDTTDTAVMTWWTAAKGFKEPKNGKVSAPMRARYLKEHQAAS